MTLVRVGIVGCGWIAQTVHVPLFIDNPSSKLVAICDADEKLLNRVADKYDVQNRYRDYRELLDSRTVDAIIICTPTSVHAQIAVAALKAGLHVLCEKPLASNMEEAEAIAAAVQSSSSQFMVGFNYRFLPNHIKARELIHSGRIGTPAMIRAELVAPGPYKFGVSDAEVAREAEKRKGCLFDLGAHIADLFIWMMGDPIDVQAAFTPMENRISVDRTAVATVRFKSNVLGSILVTWQNLPDYEAMAESRIIEIVGTRGKIDSEFFGPSLYFYSAEAITSKIKGRVRMTPMRVNPNVPGDALKSSYKKEIASFLDAIIKHQSVSVTVQDGVKALNLVLSAYESAKTGRAISLE